MQIPEPVQFKGAPGSPYTRKMLAYLRFRHIRYQLLVGDQTTGHNLPEPKVNLLPTFFLPDEDNSLQAVVDSTPLIRRFEADFEQRRSIPEEPVLAFLNYLIEDYADEWLTKAMADSVQYQRQLWKTSTIESLAKVKAKGVSVIYPDKAPFLEAVKPLHESFNGTPIGELIQDIKGI